MISKTVLTTTKLKACRGLSWLFWLLQYPVVLTTGYAEPLQCLNRFCSCQNGLKTALDVQQGLLLTSVLPIFYKPSTASVVVKLCTWRSSTDIQQASVKVGHSSTGFQILSRSSKCACGPSRGFQEVLWWSKLALQTTTGLQLVLALSKLVFPTSTGLQQTSWQPKLFCQTSTGIHQALR